MPKIISTFFLFLFFFLCPSLLAQQESGGWPKNTPMHLVLTKKEKKKLEKRKSQELQSEGVGSTTDNGATVMEMVFLSKVFGKTGVETYKQAFLDGVDYLIEAQYDNGGWPQFYPLKNDYSRHITYNDESMVNIMKVMDAIGTRSNFFSITVDEQTALKAQQAWEKGIQVILKSQYIQNGELTVWCAQHDEVTLEPVQARSYELPSLSGGESAGIVLMLMEIENPSREVANAIQSAVRWFEKTKIEGIKIERHVRTNGARDLRVVKDENAPPHWARFYGLTDNRPFFCDRDGIKKYSLEEIGIERRNGYSWYTDNPQAVLDLYEEWKARWAREETAFLFSYFTGNGEDGLHLAWSEDGLKWESLKKGASFLIPEVGQDKLMRDPCIIQGPDGLYHMVWTVSWAERGIGYANSKDLLNWSDQLYIPVMEYEDSAVNCWAPELFYDEEQDRYMICWATTIVGKYPETLKYAKDRKRDHRMYYVTTKDFKNFSETGQLYNQGFNVIDAVITKEGAEYVMFLKDETLLPLAQKNIKIARSQFLTHGYGPPGESISPDSIWVEGPTIVRGGSGWRLYYDQYRLREMGGMESADLVNWTDITDHLSFPEGTRHGTVFKVPRKLLDELREEEVIATPAEEKRFKQISATVGELLFEDNCTGDWKELWSLDGKEGTLRNSPAGMDFSAGPEIKNDAHHAVLWTRETFSGDLMIEYDYTRLDTRDNQVNIIYIEATGWGKGPYSKEIFDWNELREVPSMSSYFNNMNTLHISYAALSEQDDYVRARRYRPDLGTGLKGTDLGATYNTGFFDTGVTHHITIIKKGYELFMKVESGEKSMLYKWNYQDHPIITEGRIGLRHMFSRSARYSNFKVKRITKNSK